MTDSPSRQGPAKNPYASRAQREFEPWSVLKGVWRREYPPGQDRNESLTIIVQLAATPVLIARRLSPSTLLRKCGANTIDLMVLGWTVLTAVALFSPRSWASSPRPLSVWMLLIYAWFRLADILSQKLLEILLHSFHRPLFAGVQRSIVLGALNLYEIVAAFSILYLGLGSISHNGEPMRDAGAAIYFSTVTAFTVGFGDFTPDSAGARHVVMAEIGLVAVYLLAWFPRAVSLLFPERDQA